MPGHSRCDRHSRCDGLVSETSEEREARLQQVYDRLASKTTEERQTKLQQMSVHQRDRLHDRLHSIRDCRGEGGQATTDVQACMIWHPRLPMRGMSGYSRCVIDWHSRLQRRGRPDYDR